MYGHAHVIAENRELMKTLFPLLDEQQREEAAKIGTYTESQLSHFIKKCEHEHEHDDDDREGDDKVCNARPLARIQSCPARTAFVSTGG
jgi:hypothetical protein